MSGAWFDVYNNSFLRVQKNPGNLTVPGYLTFGHTVSYDTKFI